MISPGETEAGTVENQLGRGTTLWSSSGRWQTARDMKPESQKVRMSKYSHDFFADHLQVCLQSARAVLPAVFDLISPKSIVDVGCGIAPWLAAALELGATDILGIDGEYIDRTLLMVPEKFFQTADLNLPIKLERRFNLAICVEVGEHLPESASGTLVDSLTKLAPVILFSAAIPGQGGVDHINLQWPPFWEKLFLERGFDLIDCIRWRVWDREDVQVWYAQNCLLFVQQEFLAASPRLLAERSRFGELPRCVVHPKMYNSTRDMTALTPRHLLRLLPASLRRAISRRLSHRFHLLSRPNK
jgi:SAM-dependent methyltransferase